MPDLCLYVQVHQPYRLARYRVFDIGGAADYFDAPLNRGDEVEIVTFVGGG